MRRGDRIHSGSVGFTPARKVVTGFIRVRVGSLGRARKGSRIHSGSRGVYSGARTGHSCSRPALIGSIGLAWVHLSGHRGRRFHSGSCGFTRARLVVAGFINVRFGSFWRA